MAGPTPINLTSTRVYNVVPLQGGRWEVMQAGGATMIYEDKETAITAAVELARTGGPGTVKIYGVNGAVESERVVGVRDRSRN